MHKKTILIIEPQVLGHHKSYLKLVVESFLLNYNVIIGTISENETWVYEGGPLCQDTCPLSNLSIQTKAGGGKWIKDV
jgi:hypothetical protein